MLILDYAPYMLVASRPQGPIPWIVLVSLTCLDSVTLSKDYFLLQHSFVCVKWLCFSGKLVRRKWRLPASFSWFWLSPSISRWRQARSQYKHFDGERKSDLCSACLRLAECVNSLLSWHFSPTSIEAWIPPMIIKIFQVFIDFFEFFAHYLSFSILLFAAKPVVFKVIKSQGF